MGARGSGGHARGGPAKKGAEASLPDTTTDCTPPAGMSVEALVYWNHHAPLQAARGLLTQSGRFLLRRYCQIAALFDRVIAEQDRTEVLMLTSTVDGAGNEKIKAENNPLGARAIQLSQQMHTLESDLLLSPAAAMRMPAATKDDWDDLDAWAGTTGPRIKAVK